MPHWNYALPEHKKWFSDSTTFYHLRVYIDHLESLLDLSKLSAEVVTISHAEVAAEIADYFNLDREDGVYPPLPDEMFAWVKENVDLEVLAQRMNKLIDSTQLGNALYYLDVMTKFEAAFQAEVSLPFDSE